MRVAKYVLLTIYALFVIVTTILLFTFNKFSDSKIGNVTIADSERNISTLKKGDLFIILNKDDIKVGDEILFYDTSSGTNFLNSEVVKKVLDTDSLTYVIRDNEFLSSEYIVGTTSSSIHIPLLGYLYVFFTSKIGYLLFVIIPIIIYFIILLKKYKYAEKKN
ncbi:MAG: hypothetical protein IKG27_04930 [Bacilli bacterium]|nr:hypothetical protein [Bacilli bacterium]